MSEPRPQSRLDWQKRIHALKNIPALLKIVWQSGPVVVSSVLAVRLLSALVPVGVLAIMARIVQAVVDLTKGTPLPTFFWWLVVAEFALAAVGAILSRFIGLLESLLADRFQRHLSIRVMDHASRLDLASYEDPAFYDKLERARVQATDRIAMVQWIGLAIQQTITAFTFCAVIFAFSPWLLLFFLAVIPAVLGESHFAFMGYSLNFSQTPMKRRLDYLRILGASKESAKELRLFGLGPFLRSSFAQIADKIYEQNVALAKKRFWAGSVLSVVSTLGYYGAYALVVLGAVRGQIGIGQLTLLAGAISGASIAIQNIFATLSSIADQALFLTDLVDFFAVRPRIVNKPDAIPAPRPIRDGFRFENVSFVYPDTTRLVLDQLNFSITPGERIALIGENGQGKTTIVKLLTRLYDPTEGRVLLDGVDLRDYDHASLCQEIGVIFQDFMRYEMTARENIAVGRIDSWTDGDLDRAARQSLAHDVIARLPGNYDQLLGRRFEGGVDLSGGEWQRLAIARAYLRDAQLLILDEPTASLDARSEYEVFQQFSKLTEGRMAILISHRFSTVRMADRILVLENGRIAEQGSHDQLMVLGRRYSEMFELQAASYR